MILAVWEIEYIVIASSKIRYFASEIRLLTVGPVCSARSVRDTVHCLSAE